jgi:hypothetical protein
LRLARLVNLLEELQRDGNESSNDAIAAVAFCYFETLVRTAEPYKFQEEVARLKSFRNVMNDAGFDEELYVDFAVEAYDLLESLANVPVESGLATVVEAFNDVNRSLSIITFLKVGFHQLSQLTCLTGCSS